MQIILCAVHTVKQVRDDTWVMAVLGQVVDRGGIRRDLNKANDREEKKPEKQVGDREANRERKDQAEKEEQVAWDRMRKGMTTHHGSAATVQQVNSNSRYSNTGMMKEDD